MDLKTVIKYREPTQLKISTYTIISYIFNNEKIINLDLLSRIIKVYNENDEICTEKEGGVISVEYYSDFFRGNIDKIIKYLNNFLTNNINKKIKKKKDFSNQVTINFKYFIARNINIFIFNNGKLKMSGLNSIYEGTDLSNKIINAIKKTKIRFYTNLNYMINEDTSNNLFNDFKIFYNYKTNKLLYYRYKYYNIIHFLDKFKLDFFEKTEREELLKQNKWVSGLMIDTFITRLKKIENENKEQIVELDKLITDFESKISNNYLLTQEIFNENKSKLFEYKESKKNIELLIFNINSIYYKINNVKEQDNNVIKYLFDNYKEKLNLIVENCSKSNSNISNYYEYDFIENTSNLKTNNLEAVLINSNFNTGFYINNSTLHKIIDNYNIFSSYNPNDYPAVKIILLINKDGLRKCTCEPHCLKRTKKNINCKKITISVFDTGSVLILGKSIDTLKNAYSFINNVLKDNYDNIKRKTIQINTQEFINNNRVLSKKKLFYYKKEDIVDYDYLK
jgi:TATA-box binding protein (TBP) (component of TFIID and TFIIIB)